MLIQNNTAQRISTTLTTAAVLLLSHAIASAHPGHGFDTEPASHFATSPDHLITLTAMGAGMLLATVFVKRLAARRAMQITGVAAIAVAAVTFASQLIH